MENLYNVLGVAPNASDDDIKKVYRSLAMRFHPDRNQAPGAEARFKSVTKAYEILADPAKRAEYDQSVNTASSSIRKRKRMPCGAACSACTARPCLPIEPRRPASTGRIELKNNNNGACIAAPRSILESTQ